MPPPGLAPLATDPSYRYQPYRQFTGFEGLPQMGGPMGQMLMQYLGSQFMGQFGMMPMGLTEQNMYDRMQSMRLQKMHDEFLAQASREDKETYYQALRGLAATVGSPWERPQIEAAENLAEMMAAAGPMAVQMFPAEMLDQLGGMRGMNVVMAEHMFRGGRFRMDPVTGRTGLENEQLTQLNRQVFDSMFAGDAWRRGAGLSAGEAGQLFNELQQLGMVGGGSRIEDLMMQVEGIPTGPGTPRLSRRETDILRNRAEALGITSGGGEFLTRELTPEQLQQLRDDPEVGAVLQSFDSRKVVRSLESYSGAVKAMREIFGDAGNPHAPLPELINALNQLTGGALPQLNPTEVENMARVTTNLARTTGLGLEATLLMSQAAVMQAQEMGLPPIFASDALQHSLAFRGAYQQLGMGAHPAWGLSGIDEQTMRAQQLTMAAAGSRLSNQIGAALRIQDALAPEGQPAFRQGSRAAAYMQAVRDGADNFVDPTTGNLVPLNMSSNDFIAMLSEGATFNLPESAIQSFLQQHPANLEQVQAYGVAPLVRRQQRGEMIEEMIYESELIAQEQIAGRGISSLDARATQGLGFAAVSAATHSLFNMTAAQRTDRETRNRLMAEAVEEQLEALSTGEATVEGVSREQARDLLQQFRADDNFRAMMVEGLYGQMDTSARRSRFGSMGIQDMLQQADLRMANRNARNIAAAQTEAMEQRALSPLGRSGMMRRGIQAVIDAGGDPDANLLEIFASGMGGVRKDEIAASIGAEALTNLQRKAEAFRAAALRYEQAEDPRERAALAAPLRAAQEAYEESVADIANTARREGLSLGGVVDADDAARSLLATDHLARVRREAQAGGAEWAADPANRQRMAKAVEIERRRRDDLIGKLYGDPEALARLGNRGLTGLRVMTGIQQRLDYLAEEYAGGDMAALLRGEFRDDITPEKRQELMREIFSQETDFNGRGVGLLFRLRQEQTYFQKGLSGGANEYDYLSERDGLDATLLKIGAHRDHRDIGSLPDMLELSDQELDNLVEKNVITAAERAQVQRGQAEYEKFREQRDAQKKNWRKSGSQVLLEGMLRLQNPDMSEEELQKRIAKVDADELEQMRGYYGGAAAYEEMVRGLDDAGVAGRRRRHAFAELFRDPERLRERVDETGGFFDERLGGDLTDVYQDVADEADAEDEEPSFELSGRITLVDGGRERDADAVLKVTRGRE